MPSFKTITFVLSALLAAAGTYAAPFQSTVVPSEPSYVRWDHQSLEGETCSSIETKFALQAGSVLADNPFVNCADIWTNTNLSINVPTLFATDPRQCNVHITLPAATTCAEFGEGMETSAAWIKAWNPWVNCAHIWGGNALCFNNTIAMGTQFPGTSGL